jgi:hypothetical protein
MGFLLWRFIRENHALQPQGRTVPIRPLGFPIPAGQTNQTTENLTTPTRRTIPRNYPPRLNRVRRDPRPRHQTTPPEEIAIPLRTFRGSGRGRFRGGTRSTIRRELTSTPSLNSMETPETPTPSARLRPRNQLDVLPSYPESLTPLARHSPINTPTTEQTKLSNTPNVICPFCERGSPHSQQMCRAIQEQLVPGPSSTAQPLYLTPPSRSSERITTTPPPFSVLDSVGRRDSSTSRNNTDSTSSDGVWMIARPRPMILIAESVDGSGTTPSIATNSPALPALPSNPVIQTNGVHTSPATSSVNSPIVETPITRSTAPSINADDANRHGDNVTPGANQRNQSGNPTSLQRYLQRFGSPTQRRNPPQDPPPGT